MGLMGFVYGRRDDVHSPFPPGSRFKFRFMKRTISYPVD